MRNTDAFHDEPNFYASINDDVIKWDAKFKLNFKVIHTLNPAVKFECMN